MNQAELADVTVAILAGGLGTRLRPAVDCPKVLAPVAGRPFLTYLLDALHAVSVRRVVLLTGHRGEEVRQELGDCYDEMALVYSAEPSPQGTGGAVRHALPQLSAPTVLLLNGDSYCEVDLTSFVRFHRRRRADLSLALARGEGEGYGRAQLGPVGQVTAFAEKAGSEGWINAGGYLIERRLLEDVPPNRPISLERELLPTWVESKAVYGYRCSGPVLDIGTPEAYAAALAFFALDGTDTCKEASHARMQAGARPEPASARL
jgi:NDP-sugar pyrophosphorylase family protein